MNKAAVEKAFASYTQNYDPDDPKIKLKINHTYRVADLCERIARTVPGADTDLAWLMGMLHDIGRFEQVRRYGTFMDAKSVDHAAFGADLLLLLVHGGGDVGDIGVLAVHRGDLKGDVLRINYWEKVSK